MGKSKIDISILDELEEDDLLITDSKTAGHSSASNNHALATLLSQVTSVPNVLILLLSRTLLWSEPQWFHSAPIQDSLDSRKTSATTVGAFTEE